MLVTPAYAPPSTCPASTFIVIAPSSPLKHTALIQTGQCLHSTCVHRAGFPWASHRNLRQLMNRSKRQTDHYVFPEPPIGCYHNDGSGVPSHWMTEQCGGGDGDVREVRRTDIEEGRGKKSLGVLQSVCQRNSTATRAPTCVTLNSWSRHMISPPQTATPPNPVRLEIEDSCPGCEVRPAVTTCRPRQMIDSLLIPSNRMRRVEEEEWGADETEWWWWWWIRWVGL